MTTRIIGSCALAALMAWIGCAAEVPRGDVGVTAGALTGNCSGLPGGDPIAAIDRLEVIVTDRGGDVLASSSASMAAGQANLSLKSVPVGLDNVLTLLGYNAGSDAPSWFGRRRDVSVLQDRTTEVSLVLTRLGGFTCVTPPAGFAHRIFPATAVLGDGRVLIAGGFTSLVSSGDRQWTIETTDASRDAYLYDPATGTIVKTGRMNAARGGHAAVYLPLPEGDKVVIFGGATQLRMLDNGSFPFQFDPNHGLDSYEVFDVGTGTFAVAGNDAQGTPKKMSLARVFPVAARLFDNTILVTGGGPWASGSSAYMSAEIWKPAVDEGRGGFLAFAGSLTTNRPHNGAAVVKLEDTSQGLSRYLIVGGTTDNDSVVEIFTQSSRSEEVAGTFKPRDGVASGLPRLFFPSVSRLRDRPDGARRFLVAGGAVWDGTALRAPAGKAWVMTVESNDRISTSELNDACLARFMHSASVSFEGDRVTLLGGFGGLGVMSDVPTCFFDLDRHDKGEAPMVALASGQEGFLSRGGHVAERLIDDTLLLVGGIFDAQTLSDSSSGLIELYAPPVLRTDLSQ